MNPLRLVSAAAALAACYTMAACGTTESGAGASGGVGTGGASGGASTGVSTGGASSNTGGGPTGGLGSGGTPVTTAECLASHFSGTGITSDCKSCMCQCNAALASICDQNCWSLTRCVQVACAGAATDITCITSMCATFLAGATTAARLTSCFTQCAPACSDWFAAGGGAPGTTGGAPGTTGGAPGTAGGGVGPSGGAAGMTNTGGTGAAGASSGGAGG